MQKSKIATQLRKIPFPIWLVNIPNGNHPMPPFDEIDLFLEIDPNLVSCMFRGVCIERLNRILKNAIDVEPVESIVYVDKFFEKAWEYGSLPKIVMAFDPQFLQKTYRELPTSSSQDEINAVRCTFPNMITSDDNTLWFSRIEQDDPRIGSLYEIEYARWIEHSHFDALKAVFIFVRPDDRELVLESIRELPF